MGNSLSDIIGGAARGLSFPIGQRTEIEFRDGKRVVPEYLANMMAGIETHRLTYEEAVEAANHKAEADLLNAQHEEIVTAHFRDFR